MLDKSQRESLVFICSKLDLADWSLVPDDLVTPMRRYLAEGIVPGRYLASVIMNDLAGVCRHADLGAVTDPNAFMWVCSLNLFLREHAPAECHGSAERLAQWHDLGGLIGLTLIAEYGEAALA